jgi:GAF domain-containing protein
MNEDQLNRSLEDLFSDASLPEPEISGELETPRKDTGDERLRERLWGEAVEGRPRAVGPGEAPGEAQAPDGDAAALEAIPLERRTTPETSRPSDGRPSRDGLHPSESPQREAEAPVAAERAPRLAAPSSETSASPIDPSWRQKLLQVSLYGALIIGLVIVALGGYRATAAGRTILLPFYVATYALLLGVTFWEQVPYDAQVASFLAAIYGLGVLDLVQFGPDGGGQIFLLILPILTVLFSGKLGSVIALLASFVTQALFGWLVSAGRFVPLELGVVAAGQAGRVRVIEPWWLKALALLLLGTGLILVQRRLTLYLAQALEHGRKLMADLATYRARAKAQRQELKQRDLQLDLVVEIGRIAASRLGVDSVLHRAVQLIPDYLNCYMASVFLLDESGEAVTLRAATGAVGAELEAEGLTLEVADTSIVGWTAKRGKPYVAPEVSADDLYRPHPVLGGTMSEAAVPLKAHGVLLGVLDVQAGSRNAFKEREIDLRVLRGVADQLAMVVQSARQTADETVLLEATSPLYRINHLLNHAMTLSEVVQVIVDSVAETEADGCLVGALERSSRGEAGDALRYLGSWRQRTDDHVGPKVSGRGQQHKLRPGVRWALSESALPLALVERFWWTADVKRDDRLSEHVRDVFAGIDARACVNVPLRAHDQDVGHMLVLREKPGSFSRDSMRLFEVLGGAAAVALTRARQLDEAQRRARQEELASRATARMHESLDLESVLSTAVRDIGETLGLAALDVRLGPVTGPLAGEDPTRGNGGGSRSEMGREEEG